MIRLPPILCLLLTAVVSACATTDTQPDWKQPTLVPNRWIHDFDYDSDIKKYLHGQFDSARLEGATAYVYLYSDLDSHCLGTRKVMILPEVDATFLHVRVTMLNLDRLEWLHRMNSGVANDPEYLVPILAKISARARAKWLHRMSYGVSNNSKIWVPILAKISVSGELSEPVLLPDMYLFHPVRTGDSLYPVLGKPKVMSVSDFAKKLQQFFEAHSEI